MPSPQASRRNLERARAVRGPYWRQPRPWRCSEESRLIRLLVWQVWWNAQKYQIRASSGRALARKLGVSHTWVQRLLREVRANPEKLQREVRLRGLATMELLSMAQEKSRELRGRGELRDKALTAARISRARRRGMWEETRDENFAQHIPQATHCPAAPAPAPAEKQGEGEREGQEPSQDEQVDWVSRLSPGSTRPSGRRSGPHGWMGS